MPTSHRSKLMEDLQVVIEDAEALLRMTAKEAGEGASDVRQRVQARMEQAKLELLHLQDAAVAQAKAAGQAADAFVHDNPWKAVGVGVDAQPAVNACLKIKARGCLLHCANC